jgi:hypothetical protein
MIGLDPCFYGTHSLRRTKATLFYKKTGNPRNVRLWHIADIDFDAENVRFRG